MREAAARQHCSNNLKQIGIALHHYHDAHRHYPVGMVESNVPVDKRLSWLVYLLPYLEQEPLAKQLDVKAAWDADKNRGPVARQIHVFLCPAGDDLANHTFYVGLTGIGLDAPTLDKDHARAGYFGHARRITWRDVKDGTSMTVAAMETMTDVGPWAAGPSSLRALMPDETTYISEDGPFGMKHKTDTFFRTNPVLANVLLGDASVRGLSPTITPETLRALVTIAGSDEVGRDY